MQGAVPWKIHPEHAVLCYVTRLGCFQVGFCKQNKDTDCHKYLNDMNFTLKSDSGIFFFSEWSIPGNLVETETLWLLA